jgi:hypothetical protein
LTRARASTYGYDARAPTRGISRLGVPFASPNALFNLSKFSVRWLRLGIQFERIKPGDPQENTTVLLAS